MNLWTVYLLPIWGKALKGYCETTCFLFPLNITWYLKLNRMKSNWGTPALTTIWEGFIVVHFEVEGGGGGITTPAYLKLVRIRLEIWSLVRRYIHIYNFRKFSFYYQSSLNFVDISIFLQKISIYFYSKVLELR